MIWGGGGGHERTSGFGEIVRHWDLVNMAGHLNLLSTKGPIKLGDLTVLLDLRDMRGHMDLIEMTGNVTGHLGSAGHDRAP